MHARGSALRRVLSPAFFVAAGRILRQYGNRRMLIFKCLYSSASRRPAHTRWEQKQADLEHCAHRGCALPLLRKKHIKSRIVAQTHQHHQPSRTLPP